MQIRTRKCGRCAIDRGKNQQQQQLKVIKWPYQFEYDKEFLTKIDACYEARLKKVSKDYSDNFTITKFLLYVSGTTDGECQL